MELSEHHVCAIEDIRKKYQTLPACDRFAKEVAKALKVHGVESEYVVIRDRYTEAEDASRITLRLKNGEMISEMGFHIALKVGDKYLDQYTVSVGLNWPEYISQFIYGEFLEVTTPDYLRKITATDSYEFLYGS